MPGDLSVTSWDDSQLATLMRPSITALRRDNIAYGALAATTLLDLVEGRNRGSCSCSASRAGGRADRAPRPVVASTSQVTIR